MPQMADEATEAKIAFAKSEIKQLSIAMLRVTKAMRTSTMQQNQD